MKKDILIPKLDGEKYDIKGPAHRGMAYVFDERKVVYVPIPKSASDSFRKLKNFKNINLEKEDGQKTLKEKQDQGYKFVTILRNPMKRFISIYLEVMHRGWAASSDPSVKLFMKYRNIKDFNKRLSVLLSDIKENYTVDPHFPSQTFYAGGYNFDYVFDIEKLGELSNIGITLPHTNAKSPISKKSAETGIINSGLVDEIKSIYKNDYEIYKMIGGKV